MLPQPPGILLLLLLTPSQPFTHCLAVVRPTQTLENTREADVTMVSAGDEEVALDEADDEFAGR